MTCVTPEGVPVIEQLLAAVERFGNWILLGYPELVVAMRECSPDGDAVDDTAYWPFVL